MSATDDSLDAATALNERFAEGNRCLGVGDAPGAAAAFRAALELAPLQAELHANLAFALEASGAPDEAAAAYRQARALAPEIAQIAINFGAFLVDRRQFAEAEAVYCDSLLRHPQAPGLWSNYGALLTCLQREDEAERCYRTALELDPGHASAGFNLAYLLLRQGRWEEGWRRLEARDWYARLDAELGLPRWRGEALAGKSLLIGLEAGHGDMIQFCRYAAQLKQAGAARVSVLCHPALKTLFAVGLDGVDDALAPGDPAPDGVVWDYWAPPLSLPFHFATRVDRVPAELPYLQADAARIAQWSAALGPADGRLRVGLVWKGSRGFENDGERSLPSLAVLAPLGDVPGVRFVSLQKGQGEDELADPPFPLLDLGTRVGDFADTAAVVSQLDLLIAVDTAVAHLAGALGKPVWLLLPDYKTDWRWLTGRDDSPWYPRTMRLFRQPAGGGWAVVVAALRTALAQRSAASAAAVD
ncbi:MAG: tetratricopeptide repeat protein [Azonexaceae bacterium]|nr:tetratricopeptide repeat protein [Azonexaceae bacterium]